MAKILYGGGTAARRGRLRGFTYQRSIYGEQVNTSRWAVNRKARGQGQVRSAFRSVVSLWRTLTQNERDSWALSASDHGGAYQAYVKYNIPYWILHHSIVRENPNQASQVQITTISATAFYNTDGTPAYIRIYVTANVNWEAAALKPLLYAANGNNYGVVPARSNAAVLEPSQIFYLGTQIVIQIDPADFPNVFWTVPGIVLGFWVTPVDSATELAVGSEAPNYLTLPGYTPILNPSLEATATGSPGPITVHIRGTVGKFIEQKVYRLVLNYQVGITPNEPYDQNKLTPGDSFEFQLDQYAIDVSGNLQQAGINVQGTPGNPLYILYSVQDIQTATVLSSPVVVGAIMQS